MQDLGNHQIGSYRLGVLAVIAMLTILEAVISHRRKLNNYNTKESFANLGILVGMAGSKLVFTSYQLWFFGLVSNLAVVNWPEGILGGILGFLLIDFTLFVYHYVAHKNKFFWAFHLVHHSSPWMNLTTAYRLNWFAALVNPIFFIPALLLGLSPVFILIGTFLNLFYQFFLHTELIGKLGWIDKIFNTPSNHRVHHGSNPKYLDKNFGGILMIWDHLFGTYMAEEEKPTYGVTTGFEGHNPIHLIFHGFIDYFRGRLNSKG